MSDLKHLNEILLKIKEKIPGINVVLLKTPTNVNFLKVETVVLDPLLLYSPNMYAVITYSADQDILTVAQQNYRSELMTSINLRYYDEEKGVPTYILVLEKMFLQTNYKICHGIKEECIFSNFDKVKKIDLVNCLIERSPETTGVIYRSSKCGLVYFEEHLCRDSGLCADCIIHLSKLFQTEESKLQSETEIQLPNGHVVHSTEEEVLLCPFIGCGRSFSREGAYKKHLRNHPISEKCVSKEVAGSASTDIWVVGGNEEDEEEDEENYQMKVDDEETNEEKDEDDKEDEDKYDQTVLFVCETSICESQNSDSNIGESEKETNVKKRKTIRKKAFSRRRKSLKLVKICDSIKETDSPQCSHCQITFSDKLEFVQHMKIKHPDLHRCETCNKSFSFTEELVVHTQKYHSSQTCSECGVVCANQNSLSSHMSAVHRSTLEPCYVCAKWMKKSSIAAHIRMVHQSEEQRTRICNICGKGYKTKTDLDRHFTKHTGQKKYYCSVCGKGYRFWGGADDCQRKHDQNLRHVCTEPGCSKGFNSRFRLDLHIRTHTGVKPFQCPVCPYDCTRKDNLRKHIRGSHKYTLDQIAELEKTATGFRKLQE